MAAPLKVMKNFNTFSLEVLSGLAQIKIPISQLQARAITSFSLPLSAGSSNSNYPSLIEDQSKQEKVNLVYLHLRIILGFFFSSEGNNFLS